MNAYECPVCEGVGPEPCQDVLENALLAVLVADWDPSPLRRTLEACGYAVVNVPFLMAQSGWPMALTDAEAHEAQGCSEPGECEDCWRAVSVRQVDAYFWATRTAALAES